MKRFVSIFNLFVLFLVLIGIIWGTIYVLNHKGIREKVENKPKVAIERVTSNQNKTNLSEIYNIYLNQERHKVKIEYQLVKKSEEKSILVLYLYFDGKKVLEKEVVNTILFDDLKELFLDPTIYQYVRIDTKNFQLLKLEEKDYLLITFGSVSDDCQEYYYLINNDGDAVKKNGFLIFDSSKDYVDQDGTSLTIYYGNQEEKRIGKLENQMFYVWEEKKVKKELQLIEYKYYLKNGKLEKEKVQIIKDVKLKEKDQKKS